MATRIRLTGNGPLKLLAVVAVLEFLVNRIAVPTLRPGLRIGEAVSSVPTWFTALDYLGLFTFYFLATIAVAVLAQAAVHAFRRARDNSTDEGWRIATVGGAALAVAVLVTLALFAGTLGVTGSLALELSLLAIVVTCLVRALRRGIDLGGAIGLAFLCVPLVLHVYGVIAARWVWVDAGQNGEAVANSRLVLAGMCLFAIASPYTLGPRPLARSLTALRPLGVAVAVSVGMMIMLRTHYGLVVEFARDGLGVGLLRTSQDPRLAMLLLGTVTISWTLAACFLGDSVSRRRLGMGLLLVVSCGSMLSFPGYFAVTAVGLIVIVDELGQAALQRRTQKSVDLTPPIDDHVWQGYLTQLVAAMRAAGHSAQALTTRGRGEDSMSVLAGRVNDRDLQVRIARQAGSVLGIDIRFGHDLIDGPKPTFTAVTRRDEALSDSHPEPPTVRGSFKFNDAAFDERFRCRGNGESARELLNDAVREKMRNSVEGWIAVWSGKSVRWVTFPGRGASLDRPVPLAELAGRGQAPDASARMVAAIELLGEIARRTLPVDNLAEPTELPETDADPVADSVAAEPS